MRHHVHMDSLRVITQQTVIDNLRMPAVISSVRAALTDQASGQAENLPRRRLRVGKSLLHMLAGSWAARGVYGQKIYSVTARGPEFYVLLFPVDGSQGVFIEADRLGQLRTGAATGVASKALARPDSRVLGVIGSGYQMRTQVEAVCAELPIERVQVFSPTEENRLKFAAEMTGRLGKPVMAVDSAAEAAAGADVINVLTTSREPVLLPEHLQPGVHVNAAGSNRVGQQEIATGVFESVTRVVTDDIEQAQTESGDLVPAVEAGLLDWAGIHRLADVVADPPERGDADITFFKSHGLGLWDVAAAVALLDVLDGADAQASGVAH